MQRLKEFLEHAAIPIAFIGMGIAALIGIL